MDKKFEKRDLKSVGPLVTLSKRTLPGQGKTAVTSSALVVRRMVGKRRGRGLPKD